MVRSSHARSGRSLPRASGWRHPRPMLALPPGWHLREWGFGRSFQESRRAVVSTFLFSCELEHRVGVGRFLRDRLDHVPVLEDLAAFQAEDVHHRLSAGIIGQAAPMTVKDDVVAVGKDTLDLAAS